MEPVAGTPFGVAIYPEPSTVSGQAVASLVAGIASILVSFVVGCTGFVELATVAGEAQGRTTQQPGVGLSPGAGLLIGGAFAVLASFFGAAALALGVVGLRRTRGGAVRGRGMAVAGLVCGSIGLALTLCTLGFMVLVVASA